MCFKALLGKKKDCYLVKIAILFCVRAQGLIQFNFSSGLNPGRVQGGVQIEKAPRFQRKSALLIFAVKAVDIASCNQVSCEIGRSEPKCCLSRRKCNFYFGPFFLGFLSEKRLRKLHFFADNEKKHGSPFMMIFE